MGKSCGKGGGENQFGKGSDWWKFSIWNRVMEILAGNQENACGKILWEILVGKSCGKSCGTRRRGKINLRKAVIGGNLAFGIG